MTKRITSLILCCGLAAAAACTMTSRPDIPRDRHSIGADGVPIAYETAGVDRGGPTLVLIHGWNCDRRYWAQAAERLVEDFRVVALDLGGHGESGTDRADWSIASFGEDVASVVRDLNLRRVVLVGHSMGGPVALEAAGRLPGRVIGVVGVDTFHDIDDPPPGDLEARLEPFQRDLATALAMLDPIFFAPSTDSVLADWIRRDMAAAPPRISTPALRSLIRYDEFAALATLDLPAAAINADIQRTDVDALRRARPGFEVVIVDDAGHFLMMERPGEFARELRRVVTGWTSIASARAAVPVSDSLPAASTR